MKRLLSGLLCFVMAFSLLVSISTPLAAENGYPYSVAAGVYVADQWNFYQGECTSYCAYKINTVNGVYFHNTKSHGSKWGNANNWGSFARSVGINVDNTPAVGAIAWWNTGSTGHVAWVSAVNGNNVTIEEYNFGYVLINGEYHGNHKYNTRTIDKSNPTGYIHIKDLNPTPVNNPIGTVDSVTAGKGYIRVSGWTFDKDDVTKSIDVHVYIGGPAGSSGSESYGFTANISRRDVDNVYKVGEFHGFDEVIYTSKSGTQDIYVYAINIGSGTSNPEIGHKTVNVAKDTQSPQITDVAVSNVSSKGYTVTCTVKDDVHINRVQFPTWTLKNDQDDIISNWPTNAKASGTASGSTYTYYVKASDHNNETGTYRTHIYAYDGADNYSCYGIDVNVHDHSYTWVTDKAATCTANGSKHQECSKCGEIINKGTTIFSLGHSWSTPTYTWSSDYKTCTATRVCARDSSHKETQTVNTTSQILRQPTMTQTGTAKYTAVFSNSAFSTQTKSVSLPKTYDGFPDVKEGSWYYDAVKYCAQNGYMSGYQNENFGPNDNLKRQDFVVILANIAKADLSKYANMTPKLKDVKKGAYYAAAVNWAVDKNIIAGYDNGNFGVGDNITREQIAVILYRYKNEPAVGSITATLSKFSDYKNTSAFAVPAMAWAVQQGAISGNDDGTLAPTKSASRAQIASIIMRMDQKGMFK